VVRPLHSPTGAMKTACLIPGLAGFAAYAAYPSVIRPLDVIEAIDALVGAAPSSVSRLTQHADTLALILGIAVSGICWFYGEHAKPRAPSE
jgi:hypothetical protein